MKTEFKLKPTKWMQDNLFATIRLITSEQTSPQPFVYIEVKNVGTYFIPDKDLEHFAVNILKALKSKKLK